MENGGFVVKKRGENGERGFNFVVCECEWEEKVVVVALRVQHLIYSIWQ